MPADCFSTSEVASAVAASNLRGLPADLIAQLSERARRAEIEAGSTIHHAGESGAHLELVVSGLVRVYVSAPDGRTMTVRYCRPGALIGVATLFAPYHVRPFAIQAVSDAELLVLQPGAVRALADCDVRVARALLIETSQRVLAFVDEISGNAFASVGQRVAAHLLDLASEHQAGTQLLAPITQQALAEAAGSVREVIVRVLRELRDEGIVRTSRRGIEILQPERLFQLTGTEVTDTARQVATMHRRPRRKTMSRGKGDD